MSVVEGRSRVGRRRPRATSAYTARYSSRNVSANPRRAPPAGVRAAAALVHQRRVALERLVGGVPVPDPELLVALAVPGQGALRAVDLEAKEFLRPMLTCDRTSDPRIPLSKRSSTCAKSSVDIGALARSTSAAAANVSTSPTGRSRTGIAVARSASSSTTRDPVTYCTRSSQCDPMSATARSGPVDLEPPVPVRREGQPVLQVAAVHAPQLA